MIILRQRLFSNKENKAKNRDWKLRERIRKSGIVDEINQERENQVRELIKGQTPKAGFLGFGKQDVPHATKLTEEEIFQQAKAGRRALQDKIKFDKGLIDFYGVEENANPELFKKVNKNSAGRSLEQVGYHDFGLDTRINNKGSLVKDYIDKEGNKTTSKRARELGITNHGQAQYHMSGAEYHAKKKAEKEAAANVKKVAEGTENVVKNVTGAKSSIPSPKPKEGAELLKKNWKRGGKIALATGGAIAAGVGAKELYDKKKAKK